MYPTSFRRQVLKIKTQENLSLAEVAERFGVGVASVMRWTKKIEATTKRNKPATKIDMEALRKDVENSPDAYQQERAERLGVTRHGIRHALRRLGVTYKKKSESPQSQPRRTACLPKKDPDLR